MFSGSHDVSSADRGARPLPAHPRAVDGDIVTGDKLLLEDVRFFGYHGVSTAEQSVGVWFSVDAEMALDLAAAAVSDDVRATIDYGAVARRIVEVGSAGRVNLIERLAGLITEALLREFPTPQVRVRVRKMTPPLGGIHGTPSVELVRRR